MCIECLGGGGGGGGEGEGIIDEKQVLGGV